MKINCFNILKGKFSFNQLEASLSPTISKPPLNLIILPLLASTQKCPNSVETKAECLLYQDNAIGVRFIRPWTQLPERIFEYKH